MRGWKRLLPALAAVLTLLTGCGGQSEEAAETEQIAPVQESTPPEEIIMPDEEEERPSFSIEDYAVPGHGGIYDLSAFPVLQEQYCWDAVMNGADRVVLFGGNTGEYLYELNLTTGEWAERYAVLEDSAEDSGYTIVGTQPLVMYNYEDQSYLCFDEQWRSWKVRCREDVGGAWSQMVDGTDRYTYQNGTVWKCDLVTGEAEKLFVLAADYTYPYLSGFDRDHHWLLMQASAGRANQDVTLCIDAETGQLAEIWQGSEPARQLQDRAWLECSQSESEPQVTQLRCEYKGNVWETQLNMEALLDLPAAASAEAKYPETADDIPEEPEDSETPQAYEEEAESAWEYDIYPYLLDSGCGRSLLGCWLKGEFHLLLWDYAASEPEQTETEEWVPYVIPEYDMGELTQRAKKLGEDYGVEIVLGQQVTEAPFPDYTLSVCEDAELIAYALDVLEQSFSLYPEGYLEQLGGENTRAIRFYLSGTLTPMNAAANIANAAGIACKVEDLELIAFDINCYLESGDVVHELTHVLDHWLEAEGVLDEVRWNEMNPEGFEYYYSYIDENGESYEFTGSTRYTAWDGAFYAGDLNSVWFADPYSTTFPTEDRARMMEKILDPVGAPTYMSNPQMMAKSDYYFACIREIFDTTGWPETTSWEQARADIY